MSGNVVSLRNTEVDGYWVCVNCQHKWEEQVIVSWGTALRDYRHKCPECGKLTGAIEGEFVPDEPVWKCECGNSLMYLLQEGHYCPACGNKWEER